MLEYEIFQLKGVGDENGPIYFKFLPLLIDTYYYYYFFIE